LLESNLINLDDIVSNEKSLKSTGFLSDFILICSKPNRTYLSKLKPFQNDVDLTKIFFTLKILVNKSKNNVIIKILRSINYIFQLFKIDENTNFILDKDALISINSFSENLNNDFDKYEAIDHNFKFVYTKYIP